MFLMNNMPGTMCGAVGLDSSHMEPRRAALLHSHYSV